MYGELAMSSFMAAVGFGLVTASIVGLSAVALTLQLGVTNVPNFAHGEILTLGAFGALEAQRFTSYLVVDALVGMVVAGLAALAMNLCVLQSFVRKGTRPIHLLIVTAGLSLIIQNLLVFFFSSTDESFKLPNAAQLPNHIGPFIWTAIDMATMGTAVVAMLVLYAVLKYTKFGKAQRAVADQPELARIRGIPVTRIVNLTWLMAGLLAGLAGVAVATTSGSVAPTSGSSYLLITFAAVVLGGVGKPQGALVAAIIIGLAMEVSAVYVDAAYKEIIAVGILVLAILFRPSGLFTTARPAVVR
jgi:branched-subunit amino acid ABC-type transport system permease component